MAISSPEEASPRTGRDGRRSGGDGHYAVRLERNPPIRTRNTTTRSEIENLTATGGRPGRAAAGRTAGPPRHTERGGRTPIARVYVRRACAAFPAGGSPGGLVTCWKTPHTGHPPGAAEAAAC